MACNGMHQEAPSPLGRPDGPSDDTPLARRRRLVRALPVLLMEARRAVSAAAVPSGAAGAGPSASSSWAATAARVSSAAPLPVPPLRLVGWVAAVVAVEGEVVEPPMALLAKLAAGMASTSLPSMDARMIWNARLAVGRWLGSTLKHAWMRSAMVWGQSCGAETSVMPPRTGAMVVTISHSMTPNEYTSASLPDRWLSRISGAAYAKVHAT
mmetsp:Transcript_3516/g.10206  ORF Transcript_3516/g.10206 Transcript_3516/m.10206 type:complete len:211 (-) Transcript_3516:3788-4420(-)